MALHWLLLKFIYFETDRPKAKRQEISSTKRVQQPQRAEHEVTASCMVTMVALTARVIRVGRGSEAVKPIVHYRGVGEGERRRILVKEIDKLLTGCFGERCCCVWTSKLHLHYC
jgi:hypothetical protein